MSSYSSDPVVTDALEQWRGRSVFPTDLSSEDIAGLSRELRQRSVLSARTTSAEYLQEIAETVDDILSGKITHAAGRLRLMQKLAELGYDVATGFPEDGASVPPADQGSIEDLSSPGRLDLVLETNVRMALNYGRMVAGNEPYALYAYPAWELTRLYLRDVPRGSEESKSVGWERRWKDAGESVNWEGASQEFMIALKSSPIWPALGSGAGGYRDAIGNPYPPYAFRSGKAWRAVARAKWQALGAPLPPAESPAPMKAKFTPAEEEVAAAFDRLSPDLQAAIREELAALDAEEAAAA